MSADMIALQLFQELFSWKTLSSKFLPCVDTVVTLYKQTIKLCICININSNPVKSPAVSKKDI